jgi:flagellar biosynthesis protein FliQ
MNEDVVVKLSMDALTLSLKIALPLLAAGLVVGLVISVFQATTQLQEMTLTFIPKILVTALVLVVAGPWMLNELLGYTEQLWTGIPSIVGP